METEIQPAWLTYAEAEKLTGLSRVTLWRIAGAGQIRLARVGRAVRIERASLEQYMEQCAEDMPQ